MIAMMSLTSGIRIEWHRQNIKKGSKDERELWDRLCFVASDGQTVVFLYLRHILFTEENDCVYFGG